MDLKPIIPFEPVKVNKIPVGDNWVAQVKWDGVRILTYFDGREVRLFNRKLNERTLQFPELVDIKRYCAASSIVLDGEVIALQEGKPSFQTVMKRDGVRQPDKITRAMKDTPVIYMIFDILFYNGRWVYDLSLRQRQEILTESIEPYNDIQLVENFDDAQGLFDVVSAQGLEGIVCKDLASKYGIKAKDRRWQKLKNYLDLVAVVGGVTFRGNIVNALLLGLYDQAGRFWYIGHAGTGRLTMSEWRHLTEGIKPLITTERPFANKPERIKTAIWLKPSITVKIKFVEWTSRQTLRQPSIQAFVDMPPEDCRLLTGGDR
ncbi:MAG: RNA ligase family protein [Thermincola sp.]|nr:RNA ligase family protein [Thermincola sp.]MDT3701810.1 RNA ligase family protein [Thermincola sp.]